MFSHTQDGWNFPDRKILALTGTYYVPYVKLIFIYYVAGIIQDHFHNFPIYFSQLLRTESINYRLQK